MSLPVYFQRTHIWSAPVYAVFVSLSSTIIMFLFQISENSFYILFVLFTLSIDFSSDILNFFILDNLFFLFYPSIFFSHILSLHNFLSFSQTIPLIYFFMLTNSFIFHLIYLNLRRPPYPFYAFFLQIDICRAAADITVPATALSLSLSCLSLSLLMLQPLLLIFSSCFTCHFLMLSWIFSL